MTLIRDRLDIALLYAADLRKDFKLKNRKLRLHPEFAETESLFIHIPKTAGYSVAMALYNRDPWHFRLSEYETILNPADYFAFTVVRDPAKRLASMYSYLRKLKRVHPEVRPMVQSQSFSEFLDHFLHVQTNTTQRFMYSQVQYISNSKGQVAMDFIAKMENLSEDFKTIQREVSLPDAVLEHLNKSSGNKKDISARDQKFIETNFAEEYEQLGY